MIRTSTIALLILAWPLAAAAQMQAPVPMTPAQFANVTTGANVQLMVRVTRFKRTDLSGDLLLRRTGSEYATTGAAVDAYFPSDTPFVMGGMTGVTPGAVLFVYGVATGPGRVDVKKALVLTQYVTVR